MTYLVIKSLHLIFIVTWFAGLFYLPRLFVYHTQVDPQEAKHYTRFCIMERKLFWGIMTPSAILSLGFGLHLLSQPGVRTFIYAPWLHFKLALVALLVLFHVYCGQVVKTFKRQQNHRSALFYKIINELPIFMLVGIVLLVIIKPF
jgi:putative membrane protein